MEFYFIRGNPIALLLVSILLSTFSFTNVLVCFINKIPISSSAMVFILFTILYNTVCVIAFYLAYTKQNRLFMSPKKYNKAIKANERYDAYLEKIKTALEKYEGNSVDSNEMALKRIIELLNEGNRRENQVP
ncbi:MAG TPA: hypothetical protein VHT96_13960 [Clostridia bacterium]|nr:hypothetical protein [Clostridia bacterium]